MNTNQMLPVGTPLRGGDLTVISQLSSGGFGNAYVVRNRLDKVFAMKEFFIRGVNQRVDGNVTVSVADNKATFESQRAKFEKEAKRLSKISNPHVVRVHDLFYENGTVYYTMDYIDGESLAKRLERTGQPLSEEEVKRVLHQLLCALDCVHSQQPPLLHLDLKLANIMQDRQDNVYLIDFGSSKQIDSEGGELLSATTGFTYTQGYAPLEQVNGVKENIGPWTDFYALGATLYNLLTCRSPRDISVHEGEEAFDFPASVSAKMRNLIVWLMSPSRKKRPQTVEDIYSMLDEKHECADRNKEGMMANGIEQRSADDETTFAANVSALPLAQSPMGRPAFKWPLVKHVGIAVISIISIAFILFVGKSMLNSSDRRNDLTVQADLSVVIQNLIRSMVYVEGGTFWMGATPEPAIEDPDDKEVGLKKTVSSFYICNHEVTQEEWHAVMGNNPSFFRGERLPVDSVSWDDCQVFIKKLNEMTGKQFRLPTEAEWEFAARGGNKSHGYIFSGSNELDAVAWNPENSDSKTHVVATKQPNELGLYDMSGNVGEWCESKWDEGMCIMKGGSWDAEDAWSCTYVDRSGGGPDRRDPDCGFRVALSL